MNIITPAEQQGSGHCVICEGGIDRHTQTMVVDTLYDAELPGHYLDGRKYVCQGCVSSIVRSCGLMQATEVAELKSALATFKEAYRLMIERTVGNVNNMQFELTNLPVMPDVAYANPNRTVLASEALENEKPKRGRPAKAPF